MPFTTHLGLIFKGVVSSRINWFAFSSRHAFSSFKTFINGQLFKLFYVFSEILETKAKRPYDFLHISYLFIIDDGGVFKAKGRKQKANEVKDDKKVKEEVPIDKRKARTVDVSVCLDA